MGANLAIGSPGRECLMGTLFAELSGNDGD